MGGDDALKRTAGVIFYHMRRGKDAAFAIAAGQAHEPQLTDSEIGDAYNWAQAHLRACDIATMECQLLWERKKALKAGLPDPFPNGVKAHTGEQILRATGLFGEAR